MDFVNWIIFIFIIFFSITMHEFGHFLFAKIFKMSVYEFSIGIGPKLFSWKFKETIYSLRLFPIMAYVNLSTRRNLKLYEEIYHEVIIDPLYEKDFVFLKIKEQIKLMRNLKAFFLYRNKRNLFKEHLKYQALIKIGKTAIFMEDLSLWKNILVILGGVIVNLILFGSATLILMGLGYDIDLNFEIKNFFINLWNILTFQRPTPTVYVLNDQLIRFLLNLAMINLSLFLINILPIPILDGFKFITISYSKIYKKEINEKIDLFFGIIGIIFIIYLTIASIANFFI
ncbi:MAG: site-2 protease family protein [Mycoplasmoidaceae bacterium]